MTAPDRAEPAFLRGLSILESLLIIAALSVMIVVVFFQVFFRYVIHYSLPWSEELARYLMTWVVFVGASVGAKEGVHIGVSAFVDLLPRQIRRYAILFSGMCSVIFGLSVAWIGYKAVAHIAAMGQISPAMELPMWIAYLPICIGPLFMAVRFGQAMIERFEHFDRLPAGEASQ